MIALEVFEKKQLVKTLPAGKCFPPNCSTVGPGQPESNRACGTDSSEESLEDAVRHVNARDGVSCPDTFNLL